MQKIVECVPNFSEGRDAARVEAIVAAIQEVAGVWVLDREMDADHNRSVVTLAGEPEAVAEAVLRAVGRAAELIDLRQHQGAHPRVGATDVVPFVPVQGITLEECVALAHRVGRKIWERYRIPVYFYEAAALRADRVNLEDVRRGQFEGLREEVLRNFERVPDVGGPALHPSAGATIVGARKFLIAYNVNLGTGDLTVAQKIARAVRFSSGGLRFVKAMGVELKSRGIVQVSMNLTDFEQTPSIGRSSWFAGKPNGMASPWWAAKLLASYPGAPWRWRRISTCAWRIFSPSRSSRGGWRRRWRACRQRRAGGAKHSPRFSRRWARRRLRQAGVRQPHWPVPWPRASAVR